MRAAESFEQAVATAVPHARGCRGEFGGFCSCGATARRARLMLNIGRHVDKLTRGRVYLDGPTQPTTPDQP